MKRFAILLVAVFAMLAFTASAQKKGETSIGGNIGLGITSVGYEGYMNTGVTFSLAPELGYFIADNLKIGAGLEYSINSGIHSFAFMPNVSYYVRMVDNLYYVPSLDIGGGLLAQDSNVAGLFGFSLDLFAMEYKATKNFGFGASLVNLSYALMGGIDSLNFSILTSPTVSFRYYF